MELSEYRCHHISSKAVVAKKNFASQTFYSKKKMFEENVFLKKWCLLSGSICMAVNIMTSV